MSLPVEIKNLFFSYDKQAILTDVSLQLKKGEFLAFIGPNGGGKTTLLKVIAGLLKPSKGNVRIFGKTPKEGRKFLGYVPQVLAVKRDFPITVKELVLLGVLKEVNFWGKFPQIYENRAQLLLEEMGLKGMMHNTVRELSEGQMQRALLARALMSDPPILLLDEPTASLDKQGEEKVFEILQKLKIDKSIIMVSHDVNTIVEKADRIACVQNEVAVYLPSEICEHFALGLYHTPILGKESHADKFFKRP
jgi:zinc transport system ATP-binding protein